MTVRDQLEKLVQELVDKGVLFDDARREFEKRFIARVLQRSKGNVGDAAELLGMHRNTLTRKIDRVPDQAVSDWSAGTASGSPARAAR